MDTIAPASPDLDPASAAALMSNFGFLATSDLPDRPGPASLLVALREVPTLHHYDPEAVQYWTNQSGRGVPRTLTRESHLPVETEFSWGLVRIVDRLRVTNEYLTFGGHLSAALVDGVVVAVFSSAAPLLRRGGHSQVWDLGADSLGAFFSRFLLAVDYGAGFEEHAGRVSPVSRYAAFLVDAMARYRASPRLRVEQPELWTLLRSEERRLMAENPTEWAAGQELLTRIHLVSGTPLTQLGGDGT
jgi:hypothetical protein